MSGVINPEQLLHNTSGLQTIACQIALAGSLRNLRLGVVRAWSFDPSYEPGPRCGILRRSLEDKHTNSKTLSGFDYNHCLAKIARSR